MYPLGSLWLKFALHDINADIPVLLSIYNFDQLRINANNLKYLLIYPSSKEAAAAERIGGYPFLHWSDLI